MFNDLFENIKIHEQLIVNDGENPEANKVEELTKALEGLLNLMTKGSKTGNPYSKPEVDAAFKALGRDWRNESKVKKEDESK